MDKKLLHETLSRVADRYPDRIALQSSESVMHYATLADRFEAFASALSELGIGHGDRVAILAPNCADYLVSHYATASLGAILLVLNTRHEEPEWLHALRDAEASALILHGDFRGICGALCAGCPSIRFVVGIGAPAGADYEIDDLLTGASGSRHESVVQPSDPVLLIYTSGTTGRPKGALQTHLGSVTIDELTAQSFGANEEDVYLAFMPYFHQAGLIRSRAVATRGGRSLYGHGKLDPERLVETLRTNDVTITMLVPPFDSRIAELAQRDQLDFPCLRLIVGGGGVGRGHAARMQSFCEQFDCDYLGVYGQTEVTGPATVVTGPEYFANPATCGRALDGIELEIWNDDATEDTAERRLPTGEIGEIMIRGATCVPGYWRNEAASSDLYTDDWLHTGDLASMDDDGFVYFVDRKKELIKTGGENVYPREVEDVVREHPQVSDVAVFGLPDSKGWGERVAAAIVLREEQAPDFESIREFCRGKMAGYKIPKEWTRVDVIPRNMTGKPLKRVLRERYIEVKIGSV